MTQLIRRAQSAIIKGPAAGVITNQTPDAIPPTAWKDALNIRFKFGNAETSPGWVKLTSQQLAGTVKRLDQFFKLDGTDFLIAISNQKVYKYNTGTSTWDEIGTALTGIDDDYVQSDTVFDIFVFTNRADRVKKWTGTGTIADLGGLNLAEDGGGGTINVSASKGITSFGGFVHLVNTTEGGSVKAQRWRWSAFGLAETWNNTGTYGQAGFADITDGSDKLQTARRLGGDFIALYKERSVHIAQYVGPPTVWSRRLVVSGRGLMAPGAVADIINEHLFVSDDDIYIFNGLNIRPVGTPIFNQFISELNPAKQHLIWTHTIYEEHEVIIAYPSGSSAYPNRALVFNYLTSSWSFRDMPFYTMGYFRRTNSGRRWIDLVGTWADQGYRWNSTILAANAPQHLGGDGSGYVHDYGNGYSKDGSALESYIISGAIDTQQPQLIKRFFRVFVDLIATGTHNLEIWYLTTDNPNATLNWSQSTQLKCDLSTNPWTNIDIAGRYLFLRFRTNGTANPFKMTKYGYEFITRGHY